MRSACLSRHPAVAYDVFFPRKPPSGFRSMSHRFPAGSILFLVRPPYGARYSYVMRPLRYSINVTLDGCCDHRAMFADEDLFRHVVENLDRADALLFGRVTYEMMEAAWRGAGEDGSEALTRT